jgi:hypothetical protein
VSVKKIKEIHSRHLKDITLESRALRPTLVIILYRRILREVKVGIPVFGTSSLVPLCATSLLSLSFLWLFVDLLFKFMKRPSQRKEREIGEKRST